MTFPLLGFAEMSCGLDSKIEEKSKAVDAVLTCGTVVFDTCASLTCLVVGILGAVGVIGMPTGAAYGLIGVSVGITLLWIALMLAAAIKDCCKC